MKSTDLQTPPGWFKFLGGMVIGGILLTLVIIVFILCIKAIQFFWGLL
jgi:hypothetical protein